MEKIFIISTIDYSFLKKKRFFWNSNHLNQFIDFISKEDIENINEALVYLINNKPENEKSQKGIWLEVKAAHLNENFFYIDFEEKEISPFTNQQIKFALKNYIKENFPSSNKNLLPFCSIVNKNEFLNILENENYSLKIKLSELEKNNNWDEIVKLFEPLDNIASSEYWNSYELLSRLAFATSKLSTCSINLKKKFNKPDDKQKLKNFLMEKKKYRQLTLKLYEQCLKLSENILEEKQKILSNIAYQYYQSAQELIFPSGRRDGNFFDDAYKAISYFDETLKINPHRLNDLYRKAYLITEIIIPHIKFIDDKGKLPDYFQNLWNLLELGIKEFENLIEIYKSDQIDDDAKKRFFKYYIKSLYNLTKIYIDLINIKERRIISIAKKIHPELDINSFEDNFPNEKNLTRLNKAINLIEEIFIEIWKYNYRKNKQKPEINEDITQLAISPDLKTLEKEFIDLDILTYTYGKLWLLMYFVRNDKESLKKARILFLHSIKLMIKKRKNDSYVREKLALVYILESNYQTAFETIRFCGENKSASYLKLTFALSKFLHNPGRDVLDILNPICNNEKDPLRVEACFWQLIILSSLKESINEKIQDFLHLLPNSIEQREKNIFYKIISKIKT